MDMPRRVVAFACAGTAIALVTVALSVGGGVAATADTPEVYRQDNGVVAIDGSRLQVSYAGHRISDRKLAALQKRGKGGTGISNRELACQGITLFVDTEAELQAYQQGFAARQEQRRVTRGASGASSSADVCAEFADAPRF